MPQLRARLGRSALLGHIDRARLGRHRFALFGSTGDVLFGRAYFIADDLA